MQTTERFVNEGDALARSTEEELVVVAVQFAIEVGQLGGREVRVVGGFVPLVLYTTS